MSEREREGEGEREREERERGRGEKEEGRREGGREGGEQAVALCNRYRKEPGAETSCSALQPISEIWFWASSAR